ncbi:MAG: GIVxVP protein [Prochlorococcaceae cyanobacterium]
MSLNRTAKGIVLVPSLLLGGAFMAAAAWGGDGPAAGNRTLALVLGGLLMAAGLLAQLLPDQPPDSED